jgi:hypothetical protein
MKNASTYLYFRSKMARLTDSEKFWVMNRMAFELGNYNRTTELNLLNKQLELYLRKPVHEQNKVEWWLALRKLSAAPQFYTILRMI